MHFLLKTRGQGSNHTFRTTAARCGCRPLLCNADTSFFDQSQNTDVVEVPVDVSIRPAQLDVPRRAGALGLVGARHASPWPVCAGCVVSHSYLASHQGVDAISTRRYMAVQYCVSLNPEIFCLLMSIPRLLQ